MVTIVTRAGKGSPLTNTEVDANFTNLNTGKAAVGTNTDITSVALTTGTISTAPSANTDITNKLYVDGIASGLNFHSACNYATIAALAANTYNNGSSGVGATLTAVAVGTLTIDGYTLVIGDVGKRLLIKNEVAGANNGVYTLTQAGTAVLPYILTRATDYDTSGSGTNEIDAGDFILVLSGSSLFNSSWVQQTPLPITVGTTSITFTQFAAPYIFTYPAAGIANSTGSAWGTSYSTTGSGTVVALATSPTFVTPLLGTPTSGTLTNCTFPTLNQNTTGSAATLTTGRTIAITGDLSYTSGSFNGSAAVTGVGTLATVNSNVGAFTNANITVNAKGLVTAVASGSPGGVTSVTGTSPVASSGGTTPAISLAAAYGDTLNPYASKTANFILAAPTGVAGVPTFRAVVAADIPTLNQNTTGTAANVTGTVAIINGGTGATTATAAFDALAPTQTSNSGKYLTTNGTTTSWGTISAGAALSNDTATTSNLYPMFAAATTGTPTTVYTSNAKLLYKPSTGELSATAHVNTNGISITADSVSSSYTIATGTNGFSVGPLTINSGVVLTIASGQRHVVI